MQALTVFGSDPTELVLFCAPKEERNDDGLDGLLSSWILGAGTFLRGRLGDLLAMIEATDCTGGWTTFGVFVKGGITLDEWAEGTNWGLAAMRGVFTSMV